MKNIVICISICLVCLNDSYAQSTQNHLNSVHLCEMINQNVKKEVENYVITNFKEDNEKGVVVVRLSELKSDTANFEFYISEILKKSHVEIPGPLACYFINKRLILLYGSWNSSFFKLKDDKIRLREIRKYLVNDDAEKVNTNKYSGKVTFIIFDPENVKIIVQDGKVVKRIHQ